MSPEAPPLLLLLLLAALNSESTATPPERNSGRKFVVVFPENIAYYYPVPSQNKVWITTLYPSTTVTINPQANGTTTLGNPGTRSFDVNLELRKLNVSDPGTSLSNRTVQITSNKNIVVQAFSVRNKSMQTALVIPADKLGMKYFIPPISKVPKATINVSVAGMSINERGPFRLIIVNTNQSNTVTVQGKASKQVSLPPNYLAQIPLEDEDGLQVVEAENPVAVLVAHPCAFRPLCSCGLLYAILQPARNQAVKFPIPPALAADAEVFVLLSESGSSSAEAFNPDAAVVETSGTAVLYRPDLVLPLIPETDFASCYVVTNISQQQNFILIVVHNDDKDGIHVGNSPLQTLNPVWQKLNGTNYTSARLTFSSRNTVVWHESSTVGVYYVGNVSGTMFGHPAPIISSTPDYRGCILSPEVLNIPTNASSWQKSIKTCGDNSLKLVSLSGETQQKQVCNKLSQVNGSKPQEVWIGMRRSSATGEWYWLDNPSVRYTNWDEGQPGSVDGGQCAVMSLKSNCSWRDEECCTAVRPLCYREPELLVF
ncbi:IgGFc-binding protein [Melanotaenia boesemani]|uniref:IgGFc-binding protein n=1 Tax=Melanotaenia boesemani TaxID=1250792 RepID=UPI001C04901C|nr:IgGFc-binding protein [Melanotaenia boesemani]